MRMSWQRAGTTTPCVSNIYSAPITHGCRHVSGPGWSIQGYCLWALGYSIRFGIVYVDYLTLQRIVKDSEVSYSRLIRDLTDYQHA